jgi:two-component system OmpR family sensor kinase
MSSPEASTEQRPLSRLYIRVWLAVALAGTLGALGGLMIAIMIYDPPGAVAARMIGATLALLERQQVPPDRAQRLADQWETFVRITDAQGQVIQFATANGVRADPHAQARHRVQLVGGQVLETGEFAIGRPPWTAFALPLIGIALAVGLATFPLVWRITRRLEAFRQSVTELGRGQLSTRLVVDGNDEVADLARSFNRSAERIEELVRANRDLLANASHELRSPLTRIRMAGELLTDMHGVPEQLAPMREMRRSISELDELIDEILTASRLEAGGHLDAPQPTDLGQICADEAHRLGISFAPVQVRVLGTPHLLRRLVRNLLENALKYGLGRTVTLDLVQSPEETRLVVSDLGEGVPEAERERIFEAFYRRRGSSEAQGGVGLGLSLVRAIALQHGGTVHCEANLPQGARFVCRFPSRNASSS